MTVTRLRFPWNKRARARRPAPQREGEAAVFKTFVRVLGEMRATQRAAEPMHTEKAKS